MLAAPLLGLLLVTAGCSGDTPPAADSSQSSTPAATPSPAPTFEMKPVVKVGQVVGRVSAENQGRVRRQVARSVLHWIDKAYLSSRRTDSRKAFASFTRVARHRALRARPVTSNNGFRTGLSHITPTRLTITTDLLGVRGRAVGATAHVTLHYKVTAHHRRHVSVGGRLSLTHSPRGWQVFAYDIHRGVR